MWIVTESLDILSDCFKRNFSLFQIKYVDKVFSSYGVKIVEPFRRVLATENGHLKEVQLTKD